MALVVNRTEAVNKLTTEQLSLPPFSVTWSADKNSYYSVGIFRATTSEKVGQALFFAFDIPGNDLHNGVVAVPWRFNTVYGGDDYFIQIYRQTYPLFIAYDLTTLSRLGDFAIFSPYIKSPDSFPYPEYLAPEIYPQNQIEQIGFAVQASSNPYAGTFNNPAWESTMAKKINDWKKNNTSNLTQSPTQRQAVFQSSPLPVNFEAVESPTQRQAVFQSSPIPVNFEAVQSPTQRQAVFQSSPIPVNFEAVQPKLSDVYHGMIRK